MDNLFRALMEYECAKRLISIPSAGYFLGHVI